MIPGKNYKNVNSQTIQRIDLSMAKIVYAAGQIGALSVEQVLQYDGVDNRSTGATNKKIERQKKALAIYEKIPEQILKRLPSKKEKAEEVVGRWIQEYGDNEVPSWKTVVRYLEAEKINLT